MEYVWYAVLAGVGLTVGFAVLQGVRSTYRWVHEKLTILRDKPVLRFVSAAVLAPIFYALFLSGGLLLLPFIFLWNVIKPRPQTPSTSRKKKKRGPIGGSHTAEIMLVGENPVDRWAARKARDKFF